MRADWNLYYTDLRTRVMRDDPIIWADLAAIVGFNMNGLDHGPIAERALLISAMLREMLGCEVGRR